MYDKPEQEFLSQFRPTVPKCDISHLVKSYADWLLKEADTNTFPIDKSKLIEKFDIPIRPTILGEQRGFVVPEKPTIFLNASDSRERQNFTLGHELFEQLFEALKIYDAPWLRDEELIEILNIITSNSSHGKKTKEIWCDFGSANLLMPLEEFSNYIIEHGFSLKTAVRAKNTSEISLEAVIRRMVETRLRNAIFVIWEYGYKPTEMPKVRTKLLIDNSEFNILKPKKKLRVLYNYQSESNLHVPRYKSIENNSVIGQAFQYPTNEIVTDFEKFPFKALRTHDYYSEAIRVRLGEDDGVYSIIYLDKIDN